jgi:hypothetical protein
MTKDEQMLQEIQTLLNHMERVNNLDAVPSGFNFPGKALLSYKRGTIDELIVKLRTSIVIYSASK